jgi:cobalamin synthase
MSLAALVTGLAAMTINRLLGGTTGDTYGAVNKMSKSPATRHSSATWS